MEENKKRNLVMILVVAVIGCFIVGVSITIALFVSNLVAEKVSG